MTNSNDPANRPPVILFPPVFYLWESLQTNFAGAAHGNNNIRKRAFALRAEKDKSRTVIFLLHAACSKRKEWGQLEVLLSFYFNSILSFRMFLEFSVFDFISVV